MSRASLLLVLLQAAARAATTGSVDGLPGCQTTCGEVEIPYPFGIGNSLSTSGATCSRPGFEIDCSGGLMPVLSGTQIQVLDLSVMTPRPVVRVMLPVAYQCYDVSNGNAIDSYIGTVDLNRGGVYRISNSANELFVLGCNTLVYTTSDRPGGNMYYGGCVAFCNDDQSAQDDACAGIGCCHIDIPPGLTDNWMEFGDGNHTGMDFSPCDYAFIVEKGNYTFRASDLHMDVNRTRMPLLLDWAIRDSNVSSSCTNAPGNPGYACVGNNSNCVNSTNGPGYFCNCTQGYEGNPYVPIGCTNINECSHPQEYHCYGECRDTEGSYDCRCRPGYQSNGDPKENQCDPKENPCDPKQNQCGPKFSTTARLALGITLGVSSLIVALLVTLIMLQKRRLDQIYVKNGGDVLETVKGLTIFTKEELKKITKNNSEFLGKGSFGKVYKGTLPDDTMVAVKASIEVNEATKEEFTKEVGIHTQMIHKNILKLFGCCLQVDVPMLVYEFAANGSLKDVLHGINKEIHHQLPLDLRLDIAIGSAEGLRYMHSYANQAIRHGDVKPDNILLDDKLVPKISDFGLSKQLRVDDHFAKVVVGSMGYIDPVFMKTGLLTQKSDIYSFGAVLLELITRRQNVYDGNCSLLIEFRKIYEKEKSGRAMFDKEIATGEEDVLILEEIGRLAMDCLKEDVDDRPDMTEVAEQLVMLRRSRKAHNKSPHHLEDRIAAPRSFATDTSGATRIAAFSVTATPTDEGTYLLHQS